MTSSPPTLARFDATERLVHWTTAALVLVLVATGAVLYLGDLSALVGHRHTVRTVHLVAGLALPVPILLGLLARGRGRALRHDLRRLARFDRDDRRWLRRTTRRDARLAKFNPGQKLNAAFLGAGLLVMLGTGAMLRWYGWLSDDLRTGATFVHDWFALGIGLSVTGHMALALRDPSALGGMVRGHVPTSWARTRRPRWYEELTARPAQRFKETGRERSAGRSVTSAGER